jgi:hypothetical protein
MSDSILKELWAIKDGLSKECGQDLRRLFEKLKEAQMPIQDKVVNRSRLRTAATDKTFRKL